MKISIHQPEHLPWLGFFDKISKVDVFVLLDDVQFRKNYYQNRNCITLRQEDSQWLTVPLNKFKSSTLIKDIEISSDDKWKNKYLVKVYEEYRNTKNFVTIYGELKDILFKESNSLCILNQDIIRWMCFRMSIKTKLLLSSEIEKTKEEEDINLKICKSLQAEEYLSGPYGKDYLPISSFKENSIKLGFHSYLPQQKMQTSDGTNLSCLHYLFHYAELK